MNKRSAKTASAAAAAAAAAPARAVEKKKSKNEAKAAAAPVSTADGQREKNERKEQSPAGKRVATKEDKKKSPPKKAKVEQEEEEEEEDIDWDADDDDSGDDEDVDDDDDDEDEDDEKTGLLMLDESSSSALKRKLELFRRSNSKSMKKGRGVIYLGHIPHGFYEKQMTAFFSQFGTVTRLKLGRNKRTGRSKHFAFIEFKDEEVAVIVAEAMHNYMLEKKVLKCHVVQKEDFNKFVFKKGSGKRYNFWAMHRALAEALLD